MDRFCVSPWMGIQETINWIREKDYRVIVTGIPNEEGSGVIFSKGKNDPPLFAEIGDILEFDGTKIRVK